MRCIKVSLQKLICGLLLFIAIHTEAQQIAFPGAEGAGRFTSGGRGDAQNPTTVFEVTNLSDDGLPGSLRYAVNATATNRTIVFRVSGTIHLNSKMNVRANTTLAGQTAPGDGICIADYPFVISGDNVIIRYMRFRMGDKNQLKTSPAGCGVPVAPFSANCAPIDGSGGDDALGALGPSNIIIDHCSVSWSSDEALTIYRGDNLTIQWTMISEPLNYSYHFETGDTDFEYHGFGGIWGAKNGSMHHNLFAHCKNRNPRFAGISTYSPNTVGVENVDFWNNVIYDWGINTVYGGDGGNYNVVNNFYKWGPSTGSTVKSRICNPGYDPTNGVPFGKWYVDGNYVDGSTTTSNNNWLGVTMGSNNPADTVLSKVTTPFVVAGTPTRQSATAAYDSVLKNVGCVLPNRDTLDNRIINDVKNRTGSLIDVQGGYPHATPYAQTVNAWPTLNSTSAPVDTDHDGMPDAWETAHGLNPNNAADRSTIDASGYTMLELYINNIVNVNPTIAVGGTLLGFSQLEGQPSTVQTYTVSGTNLTGDLTITAPQGYEISANGSSWYNSATPLVLTATGGVVNSTTISVRLNTLVIGTYNGNISHSSPGATVMVMPVNGSMATAAPGLGSFPEMDGGFENQTPGTRTSVTAHTSTVLWEASSAFNIVGSDARTGKNYFHQNQASTSVKYVFSPVLTSALLQNSTAYMVQFWYRVPGALTGNTTTPITLNGWTSLNGGIGGTGTSLTSANVALNSTSSVGDWKLFTGTITTTSGSPTATFAGFKMTNPQSPYFDIDDFVVYPGATADVTAPDVSTAAVVGGNKTNNTIAVSWTAPTSGVDKGGYMVVRSTSATAPIPNANGVYVAGNTIGAENVVVAFIGNTTSFTDGGVNVNADSTYFYHIYTVDKAYNYSSPLTSSGVKINSNVVNTPVINVTQSLSSLSQVVGTPSSTQTYTVAASFLTGDLIVTPPANFEISVNGTNWFTTASPLILTPTNGTISAKTISVRLNANAVGTYNGNLVHTSMDAITTTIALAGTTVAKIIGSNPAPAATNVVVAKDGSGNYTTIQAAIDAAPTSRTAPYIIYIKNGKYSEKVNIPSNKPFIHLVGESVGGTIISWGDYSGKVVNGVTIGTSTSSTLTVNANDFLMLNVTVENTTGYVGDGPQALAISLNGDRNVVKNCRFISGQDTVLANQAGKRQYFKNCYIDGNTDFIFGNSIAVFDSCVIFPRDRVDGSSGGYVTAANTPAGQTYGYVFRDCRITVNRGVTNYTLGRPWQNDASTADASKSNTKTIFINSIMGKSIRPEGWSTWDAGTNTSLITYAEYKTKNFDGTPHNIASRVAWSKQLTDVEAAAYTLPTIFSNWDPCTLSDLVCADQPAEIAVSNFRAKKGTSSTPSFFSWNISWPMSGIKYELFRSSDNTNFTKVNEQTAINDTAVNFIYSEAIPAPGVTYYYYVRASKDGYIANITDTAIISSTPTINVTGSFNNFLQGMGTPSKTQNIIVSGENLTQNISITIPAGFEMSSNGGNTWSNSTGSILLTPVSGAVANTTLSVRLNAASVGSYSGTMSLQSTGAVSKTVALSGTVQADALPIFKTLLYYPHNINALDSVPFRDAGVVAGTSLLKNLTLSNGTTAPGVNAYSTILGESFSPAADGSGTWTIAAGGFGNNLNRTSYKQIVIKANANYSVRVDSVVMNTSLYAAATGKVAVAFSRSGFTTDSSDVTGGASLGVSLLSTANGAFNTPVILGNESASTAIPYEFALNGATGITLAAGDSLTVRFYYSTGSGSPGRYAKVRELYFKGFSTATVTSVITTSGTLSAFSQTVGTPSATQTFTTGGTGLSGNMTITPIAGYEVSANGGTNWFTNASPLVLTPTSGTVSNTTITVRLNASIAGTYNGNISITSSGAITKTVSLTGTTVAPTPNITATGSLNAFSQVVGAPSATQTFTVSGTDLSGNMTITPIAGYEVSANGGTNWFTSASPLVLTPTSGTVSNTTITVRLNAASAGTYNGNISITSNGATAKNIAVSGTVVVPVATLTLTGTFNAFTQTVGTPSTTQTCTIQGSNLTTSVSVTPPQGFEISPNAGTNWYTNSSPLTLNPVSGSLNLTTLTVRLNAATAGTYSGNIVAATIGNLSSNLAVNGVSSINTAISELDGASAGYFLRPNPVDKRVLLIAPPTDPGGTIVLYNVAGLKLAQWQKPAGTTWMELHVERFTKGTYFLHYVQQHKHYVFQMTKL